VVGAGNAAACAALAARETGASVAMLEAAPEEERGGNSTYTAGAMRVVFHGVDDLVQLYDLTPDEKRDVDFGRYTADEFLDDMGRRPKIVHFPDNLGSLPPFPLPAPPPPAQPRPPRSPCPSSSPSPRPAPVP
jgi:tricarballylate dehydrogenase